jgi:cellobiose phosphorylase
MLKTGLSGRVGAALDPCGAIQVPIVLEVGEERTVVFRLGAGHTLAQARELALRCRPYGSAKAALDKVQDYWQRTLSTVQVNTPDTALNLLVNGWLVYQTLACRFWARSGYYQSGGAYGFRDQLQDAMALIHAKPKLLREHLLQCASRQYPEGDVQHWWHPPAGRGVRTRCSDDYLWLPLATCRYVLATGDTGVLEESVAFIDGRRLNADEESYYDLPHTSSVTASLYQHCVRCIEHGLRLGERGLPLIGSGDWNDGLSLVGISGKGESVWLGFFLYHVLESFARVAQLFSDFSFAERCREQAQKLQINLEKHGWDGDWYCRGWFDDGTPLGSATNIECSIDSIAQSWSVLSGAADRERSRLAMAAVEERLVRREDRLIQLLDPPFDTSDMHPGYIKGYVPGVRENGGQYTHAAIWTTMAFAQLGDSQRAWSLMNLINPISHGNSKQAIEIYKVEPYVIAADVYAVSPHNGRGGWSWYTGSAGWMYRLILESLLGLSREGSALRVSPCLPEHWPTYSMIYRFGRAQYQITIKQVADECGVDQATLTLDGKKIDLAYIPLVDDQQSHEVELLVYKAKREVFVKKTEVQK